MKKQLILTVLLAIGCSVHAMDNEPIFEKSDIVEKRSITNTPTAKIYNFLQFIKDTFVKKPQSQVNAPLKNDASEETITQKPKNKIVQFAHDAVQHHNQEHALQKQALKSVGSTIANMYHRVINSIKSYDLQKFRKSKVASFIRAKGDELTGNARIQQFGDDVKLIVDTADQLQRNIRSEAAAIIDPTIESNTGKIAKNISKAVYEQGARAWQNITPYRKSFANFIQPKVVDHQENEIVDIAESQSEQIATESVEEAEYQNNTINSEAVSGEESKEQIIDESIESQTFSASKFDQQTESRTVLPDGSIETIHSDGSATYIMPDQSFWSEHKVKILAVGTLGTLIAGYKFFNTQKNQIVMLKSVKIQAQDIVADIKKRMGPKKIKLKSTELSRLTQVNQKALKTKIDAFNSALALAKVNRRDALKLEQAYGQLLSIIDQCIQQIQENPVSKDGILSAAADKFGAFCSAVKYYAWDKWVTSKKVTIS